MKRLLTLIAIGVFLAVLLRVYVVEGIYVASASMEPTLATGTNFFLDKLTFRFRAPERNDIIVFPSPVKQEHDLVKRVIALGGDTIEIRDKVVILNGAPLKEDYVKHTRSAELLQGDNIPPMTVPDGMLFVMGDNRDESGDSRDWTDPKSGEHSYFISVKDVIGKIVFLY
jgi:signal peptidase I